MSIFDNPDFDNELRLHFGDSLGEENAADIGPYIRKMLLELVEDPRFLKYWFNPAQTADDIMAHTARAMKGDIAPQDDETLMKMSLAMGAPVKMTEWRGIDIRHIKAENRYSLMLFVSDRNRQLNQELLNWLTLRDLTTEPRLMRLDTQGVGEVASWAVGSSPAAYLKYLMGVPPEQERFAKAFIKPLIGEARPHRQQCILGEFVLQRTPLAYLDQVIDYDEVRLSIHPDGIYASLVKHVEGNHPMYRVFFWSPERTTLPMLGGQASWALQVLMAGIWRDACVVKEQFITERRRSEYKARRRQKRDERKITVLPRIVRHVVWSSDEERERITRSAHTVRAFYRTLPENWNASDKARANARELGYPEPPEGFTFVQPHQRGTGESGEVEPRRVICQGLRTVSVALAAINKE